MDEKEVSFKTIPEKIKYGFFQTSVGGDLISLLYKEFLPSGEKEIPSDRAIIFFPGWGIPENDKKISDVQGRLMADYSGLKTWLFLDKTEKTVKHPLLKTAWAVQEFFQGKNFKQVIIAGHSGGAVEAMNLTTRLQETNPEIKIKGLILLDPVGLVNQGKWELAQGFIKTLLVDSRFILKKEKDSKWWSENKAQMDEIGSNLMNYFLGVIKTQKNPLGRLKNEIADMAELNSRAKGVKAPVIIIQGLYDRVSKPKETDEKVIFPNSPYVRKVVLKKWGIHGVSLFRKEQVIRVCLRLLEKVSKNLP